MLSLRSKNVLRFLSSSNVGALDGENAQAPTAHIAMSPLSPLMPQQADWLVGLHLSSGEIDAHSPVRTAQ